jgi:hypothetical protein
LERRFIDESQYFINVSRRRDKRKRQLQLMLVGLLGALLLAGAAYFISTLRKSITSTNDLEVATLEMEYDNTTDPLEKKRIACQIAGTNNVSNKGNIIRTKQRFANICNTVSAVDSVIAARSSTITATDTNVLLNKKLIGRLETYDRQLQKLLDSQYNARSPQRKQAIASQIQKTEQEATRVADSSTAIRRAYESTKIIEENVEKKIDTLSAGAYPVRWFKKGYFLRYGPVTVLLRDIENKEEIWVEVCASDGQDRCDTVLVPRARVTFNQPLIFLHGGRSHTISLASIGRAGRNPFTPAAFIHYQ